MKKSVLLVLILTLSFVWIYLSCQAFAQTRARTETGKEGNSTLLQIRRDYQI